MFVGCLLCGLPTLPEVLRLFRRGGTSPARPRLSVRVPFQVVAADRAPLRTDATLRAGVMVTN